MALLPFAGASIIKIGKKILSGVNGSNLFIDQNGKLAGDSTALIYDASNRPIINANPRTGTTGDRDPTPRVYIPSRAQNLVTNGSGLMNSNYNLSGATFDSVQVYVGGGSFLSNGVATQLFSDELLPVDYAKFYRFVCYGMSGESGGTNYSATNTQYIGIAPYDIDQLAVVPYHFMEVSGSVETTLSAALNNGDTQMHVTSTTGWYNGAGGLDYRRNFRWYPYTNAKGYTYPDYQYSRNVSITLSDFISNGLWAAGGISGSTINLRQAWPGPNIPNGAKVANLDSGGSYHYTNLLAGAVPNAWTKYEGWIGGLDTGKTNGINLFPYGTAYAQLVFLINYPTTTSANNVRYSAITFSETLQLPPMTVASLPAAAVAVKGLQAVVTDALAPTLGSTVSGGGAAFAYVVFNGSAWTVMGK